MKRLSRRGFAQHIFNKINHSISLESLMIIYDVVCEYIIEQLIHKNIFSMENFGVLSPYLYKSHLIRNLDHQLLKTKETWGVKFRTNIYLKKFLSETRDFYSK